MNGKERRYRKYDHKAERRNDKYRLFMSYGEAFVHADEAEAFRTLLQAMGRTFTEKRVMNHVKFIRGSLQ